MLTIFFFLKYFFKEVKLKKIIWNSSYSHSQTIFYFFIIGFGKTVNFLPNNVYQKLNHTG